MSFKTLTSWYTSRVKATRTPSVAQPFEILSKLSINLRYICFSIPSTIIIFEILSSRSFEFGLL